MYIFLYMLFGYALMALCENKKYREKKILKKYRALWWKYRGPFVVIAL